MKKTSVIVSILMIIASCTSIDKKTTWEYDGLKGKVKSTKAIAYNVIDTDGQISKGQIMEGTHVLIKYNPDGEWTEYRSFNSDGSNMWAELPAAKKGNIQERYDYTYSNSDSTLSRKFTYKYDKKGDVIASYRFNSTDSLISKYVYKYNNKRMTTEMLNFNSLDSLISKLIYEYDDMGNLSKVSKFDANENMIDKTINTYDNKGNRIEKYDYNSENELMNKTVYFYNENDFYSEIYYYNALDSLEKKTGYQYKYDSNGNWIEKIDCQNDSAVKITEREIEYY